jgi:hypothetical protein
MMARIMHFALPTDPEFLFGQYQREACVSRTEVVLQCEPTVPLFQLMREEIINA